MRRWDSGWAVLLALGLSGAAPAASQGPSRLPGSPYPATTRPDTLYAFSDVSWTADQRMAMASLQGLLARTKPRLYRLATTRYSAWLEDLEARHGVKVVRSLQSDFAGLTGRFRSGIKGYVLYEPGTASMRAALSLCAPLGGIAASSDLVPVMQAQGIPLLLDVRGRDEAWALDLHGADLSRKNLVYVRDQEAAKLADFSVLAGALHFHGPVDGSLAARAFARMERNGAVLGWGEEFPFVDAASKHSLHVHPADHAHNLSALSQFDTPLRQPPAPAPAPGPEGVHTVCFLMSDGDNVQWALNDFSGPRWYGNPGRGKVSLGWTAPPALAELAPTVLASLYRNAAVTGGAPGRDHFVAGPSGLGYIFPDRFPALDSAAALTARFMAKADLRILNVLGAGSAIASMAAFLRRDNIDAVFYYPFSDYSGLRGSIAFLEGKPVIGGFANLWEGFESTASLAARLNARPRDPKSAQGYSLIPVHVWSNSVDSVLRCASLLDPKVRVVAPDEFVRLIRGQLGPSSAVKRPAARDPALRNPARMARGRAWEHRGRAHRASGEAF